MELQQRIQLLVQLATYMAANTTEWQLIKEQAAYKNAWFTPEFIETAIKNIIDNYLQQTILENFTNQYNISKQPITNTKNVGIVMAGNLPLVGFHDFLCVFLSGHQQTIKASANDEVLIKHMVQHLYETEITVQNYIGFANTLKNCDAYIATGSNNSSRYFEYYFGKYPNIIRKNRTSVAIIDGTETTAQLQLLANDIAMYYGLGCRNVTKIYVPENYDFEPLLQALDQYDYFIEHHKYKHNYDYHLALLMMSNKYYMTNGSIVLVEYKELFSPVSQLHYEYYSNKNEVVNSLQEQHQQAVQCIVGNGFTNFGSAQQPAINQFADGVDTMNFLMKL